MQGKTVTGFKDARYFECNIRLHSNEYHIYQVSRV